MKGTIYQLLFADGKSYIGASTWGAWERYKDHRNMTKRGGLLAVHQAWRDHGAPRLIVLAFVEDYMLMETEQRAVAIFDTHAPNGYNMLPGGAFNPLHDPMVKERHKQALTGRKLSAEHRQRLSKVRLGKKHKRHKMFSHRKKP